MNLALVFNFNARLTTLEKLSLYLIWSIVFGPESTVIKNSSIIGFTYFFFGEQTVLEKIVQVIENKSWYSDEFAVNHQTAQIEEAMEYLETEGKGFDDYIRIVLEKMINMKVVPY